MARLGDLGKVITGNTPKTSESKNYESNDICFVKPSDIADGEITHLKTSEFNISEFAREKSRILPPESILVTCIGIIGKVAINKVECAFNQQINAIIPNRHKCITNYLAYAIQAKQQIMQDMANAPIIPILNKTQFSAIEINVPSIAQQQHIAAILDNVSNLIALRKQQLDKLDELVKARFMEMFGDPVANPFHWVVKRFDELCENLDSRRIPITASERKSGIYPYYGASGVVDYVDNYIFDEDILLISEDGANLVARVTPIAFSVSGKVWVNNHAHVVRFENRYTQTYIEQCFAQIDISDCITGTAQPKLNQAKLNAMQIPVPPESIQNSFFKFTKQADKCKLTIRQGLDKLEMMKKTLMQQYFG